MSTAKIFGKTLFILLLLVRGIQHHSKPDSWPKTFFEKYSAFHKYHTGQDYAKHIPSNVLKTLDPKVIGAGVKQLAPWIGYGELFLASCIFLDIPLLPVFTFLFLLLENLIFFNPFKLEIVQREEFYWFAVNLAVAAIALMMACEAPRRQIKTIEEPAATPAAEEKKPAKKQTADHGKSEGQKPKKGKKDN
jgi:hypothetical protein